jgi:glucose-1-phosphate adenylyltransferase
MPKPKVLALVLAGGEGSRLELLNDQLANGRPWDLDRTHGGLRLLPPQLGASEDGFHEGNADAIWRNRQLIAEHEPEVVLALSANHVYRLDYGEVLAATASGGPG